MIEPGEMAELWLIRHGQSRGNRDRRYQGQNDFPLTTHGEEQARVMAQKVAANHRVSPFSALYVSDLGRAQQTANPVAERIGLRPLLLPELREIDVGDWSGLTYDEIRKLYPDEWNASYPVLDPDLERGGGESYRRALERVGGALEELASHHRSERILVVFHGGVMRAFLANLLGMDLAYMRRIRIDNGSISRVLLAERGNPLAGVVLTLNDRSHLDEMQSATAHEAR